MSSIQTQEPVVCIPRVFANITEERIRKTFDALKIGRIARIDIIERANKNGDKYKRVFVHFELWYDTKDAIKAKSILESGKELKIIYDDPWFWKASASNWTPKPKHVVAVVKSGIRIEFDEDTDTKNMDAATKLMTNLTLNEDHRPYRERRIDPNLVAQDEKQGFVKRKTRFSDRTPLPIAPGLPDMPIINDNDKTNSVKVKKQTKTKYAAKKLDISEEVKEVEKVEKVKEVEEVEKVKEVKPINKNPEMVLRMAHAFRCEITDDIYRNNVQNTRDQMEFERERQPDWTLEIPDDTINYNGCNQIPKKRGKIVVEK